MTLRVLVTGGNGFLGSYVTRELLRCGHSVTACIRTDSDLSRLYELTKDVNQGLQIVQYDGIDFSVGYDALVHMATNYGRDNSAAHEIINTNISMPARLVESCLLHGIGTFVNTDTYYAAAGPGHNMASYILSKQHFGHWARLIAGNGLKVVNLRMEHLYGPMDAQNKFCTAIVRDCLSNKPRIPLTDGDQLRDFIYVEDAASAYANILDKAWNLPSGWSEIGVGCGRAIPLREFVTLAHTLTGSRSILGFGDLAKMNGEILLSEADNSFLLSNGWRCKMSLRDGLMAIIDYLRSEAGDLS